MFYAHYHMSTLLNQQTTSHIMVLTGTEYTMPRLPSKHTIATNVATSALSKWLATQAELNFVWPMTVESISLLHQSLWSGDEDW